MRIRSRNTIQVCLAIVCPNGGVGEERCVFEVFRIIGPAFVGDGQKMSVFWLGGFEIVAQFGDDDRGLVLSVVD